MEAGISYAACRCGNLAGLSGEEFKQQGGMGEVVSGMVVKLFGTNSSTVIQRVEQKLAEINKILPEGIKIVPYYQQKPLLNQQLKL